MPSEIDRLAAEVAEDFYNRGIKQYEIAEALGVPACQVSRLLKHANETGIVKHVVDVDRVYTNIERDDALERAVTTRYMLTKTMVVKTDSVKGVAEEKDHRIHQLLGAAAAPYFKNLLKRNDHVGVSGGRGPYFLSESLRLLRIRNDLRGVSQANVRITSLCGSSFDAMKQTTHQNIPLDADTVTLNMSRAFIFHCDPVPVAASLVNEPTVTKRILNSRAKNITTAHWQEDAANHPSIALIGIGSFDFQYQTFSRANTRVVESIKPILDKLKGAGEKLRGVLGYFPIGDVCNRLFYMEPEQPGLLNDEYRRLVTEVKQMIESLNERILTVEFDQLKNVDLVVVIAGGNYKKHAIRHVLADPAMEGIIDALITDDKTAEYLLSA